MAWPRFHSERAEPQGDNQMAAPAVTRTPNMHRAKRIAPRECGWKHGVSGHSAEEKHVQRKNKRIHLTPTGLLMEGHLDQIPRALGPAAAVARAEPRRGALQGVGRRVEKTGGSN